MHNILNWLASILTMDSALWWLWFITLPLTLVGLTKVSAKSEEFFNSLGGWVTAGMFFAIALGVLLSIPMFFWNFFALHWVFKLILFSVAYWIIGELIKWTGGFLWDAVKMVFRWARSIPEHAKKNPSEIFEMTGAFSLAFLINGRWATNLTADVAFPGLIPVMAALFGISVLFYRIILGHKIVHIERKPVASEETAKTSATGTVTRKRIQRQNELAAESKAEAQAEAEALAEAEEEIEDFLKD